MSPPGKRRFATGRGPPASLSPAPRCSQRSHSQTALGFDYPKCCRGLHRQGPGQSPHSETTRLRLSVPGAPPSWPLNTQRSSDRLCRLAQPIVGGNYNSQNTLQNYRSQKAVGRDTPPPPPTHPTPYSRPSFPPCAPEEGPGLAREPGSSSRFK